MIYCVEDDAGVRELMLYTLRAAGFEAEGFPEGGAFFSAVEERLPELVLLDIMLPGEDGLTLLKRLRGSARTAEVPVIMATAKGMEYDKVTGLDLGADDYLAKPFGMMEMVSRVRAVLRRAGRKPECIRVGGLEMNLGEHTILVDGERAALTLKEYELLRIFMEHPGIVFTRERLLQSVWGAEYVGETRTVDVHIGTLRGKLGPYGAAIETVRGVGYRMEGRL